MVLKRESKLNASLALFINHAVSCFIAGNAARSKKKFACKTKRRVAAADLCFCGGKTSENSELRDGGDVCSLSDRAGASEEGEGAGVGGREESRRVARTERERQNSELLLAGAVDWVLECVIVSAS